MAATNRPFLVDKLEGGLDLSIPSHLVMPPKWLTAHNMRFDPRCQQVLHKVLNDTLSSANDVLALPMIPGELPGYGKVLALTKDQLRDLGGTEITSDLIFDSVYRRWSTTLYNGRIYYTNELNSIRSTDGSTDTAISNAPSGKFITTWYDHMVVAVPTHRGNRYPDRVMWSHLYNFSLWEPDAPNEADHYDFVEWQQLDYPFSGVTGLAKLGGVLWVYTPTAIIPMRYTGIGQGVIQVIDDQVVTRTGNTHPWSLIALDRVHFFYDGIENNILAFDGGQVIPVGEPVRQFLADNLNPNPFLAAKMWGCVDVQNRELWWRFVSVDSEGTFDRAVVFNYRNKTWFTASTENVQSFSGAVFTNISVSELTGLVEDLEGTVGQLGASEEVTPRLYGAESGKIYRDEVPEDVTASLITMDDPVLESGDFLYGSLHAVKEARAMAVNAAQTEGQLEVGVAARDYLDDTVDWSDPANKAGLWSRTLPEGRLTHRERAGKVLRYRFKGTNARGLKFTAYEPTVYAKEAEK